MEQKILDKISEWAKFAVEDLDLVNEYQQIIRLLKTGFTIDNRIVTPKPEVALALQMEANLGLRIGDILRLQAKCFKSNRLEINEQKTGKLQYREIHPTVSATIKDFIIEKGIKSEEKLFGFGVRHVNKYLHLATKKLNLEHIATHSFRKTFATFAYENNDHDIRLVQSLLNHGSVGTTQAYIGVSQDAIDKASSGVYFAP